jgi:hypothetical protein
MLNRCLDNPVQPQHNTQQQPCEATPKTEDKALAFSQGSDKKPAAKLKDD